MRTCTKCGKEYDEYPALSRKDDKTEICPECGVLEATEAFMKANKMQVLRLIHQKQTSPS